MFSNLLCFCFVLFFCQAHHCEAFIQKDYPSVQYSSRSPMNASFYDFFSFFSPFHIVHPALCLFPLVKVYTIFVFLFSDLAKGCRKARFGMRVRGCILLQHLRSERHRRHTRASSRSPSQPQSVKNTLCAVPSNPASQGRETAGQSGLRERHARHNAH